jgi:hypothetical protein
MPWRVSTRFGIVSFLSTTTIFGTANDVTLAELALEMLFPAYDATAVIVKRMDKETASIALEKVRQRRPSVTRRPTAL